MKRPIERSQEKRASLAGLGDKRFFPRIQLHVQGHLKKGEQATISCAIRDVSSGGAQVSLNSSDPLLESGLLEGDLVIVSFAIGRSYEFQATVIWKQQWREQVVLGLEWNVAEEALINTLELEIARIIVNRRRSRRWPI